MNLTETEKTAFVERLRSDNFYQIRYHLTDGCGGRCALGVLCEALGRIPSGMEQDDYAFLADRNIDMERFSDLNDIHALSFAEIAQIVEQTELSDRLFNVAPASSSILSTENEEPR